VPLQIAIGGAHGLNTLKYQPLKIAAMEGLWETGTRVPAHLFAIPDDEAETNHFEISIPVLGSIYLTYIPNGPVHGIKDWSKRDQPVVPIVFFAFHLMDGLAILMSGRHADRLHCRAGRLDDHRDRAAAMDGLQFGAHSRFRHTVADDRCRAVAHRVDASQSGTDPEGRSARPLSAALSSQAGSADGAKLALATNASPKNGGDHGA
jgi:hypothetical protein